MGSSLNQWKGGSMGRSQRATDQRTVSLTQAECLEAATEGCKRYIGNRFDEVADRRVAVDRDAWGIDIRSAMAEMAYCKAYDLEWQRGGGRQKNRLVHGVRLKHTELPNGCLLIKDGESVKYRFVLITGSMPTFIVRGWIEGEDGLRFGRLRNPTGRGRAWYIEQRYLWPMSELIDLGYKQPVLL